MGLIAQGLYEQAIPSAQQLVQSNPLLEEASGHLIWLYAQMGQREAAVEQFEQSRELLAHELAVEPTPELQARASIAPSPHRPIASEPGWIRQSENTLPGTSRLREAVNQALEAKKRPSRP